MAYHKPSCSSSAETARSQNGFLLSVVKDMSESFGLFFAFGKKTQSMEARGV